MMPHPHGAALSSINKTCGRSPSHIPPDNIHMEMESQAKQNGCSREPLVVMWRKYGCILVSCLELLCLIIHPFKSQILTKDSVTVSVDGVVYFRVNSPIASVTNVTNADFSTRLLAQTTLRNVLGTKNLSELLSDREGISHSMQSNLDEATDSWGIKVERVEIKDVKLPQQLQRAMAAEAEATREARAKVIAAEGEMNASRALKEASLVIAESPSALQLRYLQTLNTIAAEKNSTIIFPLPMDIIAHFIDKK
nr:erythrocyte band 7 integral membrane protein-like [Paramormyrops kingsleyae]